MLVLLLTMLPSWAADCPSETTAEQVGSALQDALLAYATLDEDGFREAATRAEGDLVCLGEVVPTSTAATFHRVMGLRSFLDGDAEAAEAAFQAAIGIEPDYTLSTKIAPEGGKLHRLYESAREMPDPPDRPMAVPDGTRSWVDGTPSSSRPFDLPMVLQVGSGKEPAFTWWLPPDADLPTQVTEGVPGAVPQSTVERDRAPRGSSGGGGSGGLWAGAIASGVLTAGSFGSAVYFRGQFEDEPTKGRFHATNGSYYGSIGLGAVTLGLIGAAVSGGGQ